MEDTQLTEQEAQEKLEERKQLIEKLMLSINNIFETEIPCSIMITEEAGIIMHNVIMNFFMRLCHALGYDRQTIIAHIDMFFGEAEGKKSN